MLNRLNREYSAIKVKDDFSLSCKWEIFSEQGRNYIGFANVHCLGDAWSADENSMKNILKLAAYQLGISDAALHFSKKDVRKGREIVTVKITLDEMQRRFPDDEVKLPTRSAGLFGGWLCGVERDDVSQQVASPRLVF